MDYEHIFNELEIGADPFAVCELRGACDLGLGQDTAATLHYVLSGEGEISIRGLRSLPVAAGSLVLVPAMQSHSLHSFGRVISPVPKCRPAELELRHLLVEAKGGASGGGQLTALCAHVRVGLRGATDIIDLVREPLVDMVAEESRLRPALDMLLAEICHPDLGSAAMIRNVLTLCIIGVLRNRLNEDDRALAWMAILKDRSVWNALRAMLDRPGDPHSVESLAAIAGMSRSVFAKRFADAYGGGPMDLLRDLRIKQAGSLLRESSLPVKRIAAMVGFASRSSFSQVFQDKTGRSPRQFRAD